MGDVHHLDVVLGLVGLLPLGDRGFVLEDLLLELCEVEARHNGFKSHLVLSFILLVVDHETIIKQVNLFLSMLFFELGLDHLVDDVDVGCVDISVLKLVFLGVFENKVVFLEEFMLGTLERSVRDELTDVFEDAVG